MTPHSPSWKPRALDRIRQAGYVYQDAFRGFMADGGLRGASSLAFHAMLVLIPVLMLMTFFLSLGIGSSQMAMRKTSEFVAQVIPRFGDVILGEVGTLAKVRLGAGLLNALVLVWSLMPLVTSFRCIIAGMFKEKPRRPVWVTKGRDVLTALVFIMAIAAMAGVGLLLDILGRRSGHAGSLGTGLALPFVMTVLLLMGNYTMFMPRVKAGHLLAGALTTAVLWFLLRPAFTLFLTYNHSFGLAFGSFKSIFIVIIWIYYSLAVLLFGAQVTAALHRGETLAIKRLMEGKGGSTLAGNRFLRTYPEGSAVFEEGDGGREMYHILKGSVRVTKGGQELAILKAGTFFGEMSFLLGLERSATAVALEDTVLIAIHERNIHALMREFPDTVQEMLVQLASRLLKTSRKVKA